MTHPPTTSSPNFEDLTVVLEAAEEQEDLDEEMGDSTHSHPPAAPPVRSWQATTIRPCYLVGTPDPRHEESGEAEEINDDDIKAIEEPILATRHGRHYGWKSWRPPIR